MIIILGSLILITCIISDLLTNDISFSLTLFSSTIGSALIIKWGIPKLNRFKFKQNIREKGPQEHFHKAGTPTMGGLFVIPIAIIIGSLVSLSPSNAPQIIGIIIITFGYMIIGLIDDWLSIINKKNKGLSAKYKLFLQSIIGIIFLSFAYVKDLINSKIYLFQDNYIDLGIMIWPLALFILLAESNATNLSDGLDGLASGCGALIFTGLALQLILREGNNDQYLGNLCVSMAGAWFGFLIYNKNPAKVFMGDTGSLAMGAALGAIALMSNSLWALLIMGGVLMAESLSVIIQVSIFKWTKIIYGEGKRVFLMAPLHHHFELKGIKEIDIVNNFWLITIFLIGVGIILRTNA